MLYTAFINQCKTFLDNVNCQFRTFEHFVILDIFYLWTFSNLVVSLLVSNDF